MSEANFLHQRELHEYIRIAKQKFDKSVCHLLFTVLCEKVRQQSEDGMFSVH